LVYKIQSYDAHVVELLFANWPLDLAACIEQFCILWSVVYDSNITNNTI